MNEQEVDELLNRAEKVLGKRPADYWKRGLMRVSDLKARVWDSDMTGNTIAYLSDRGCKASIVELKRNGYMATVTTDAGITGTYSHARKFHAILGAIGNLTQPIGAGVPLMGEE